MIFVHVLCGLPPSAGRFPVLTADSQPSGSGLPQYSTFLFAAMSSELTHMQAPPVVFFIFFTFAVYESNFSSQCNNRTFPIFCKITPLKRFLFLVTNLFIHLLHAWMNHFDVGSSRLKNKLYATSCLGFRNLTQGCNSLWVLGVKARLYSLHPWEHEGPLGSTCKFCHQRM